METLKVIATSEIFNWMEEHKDISWNTSCDLFDMVPYNGFKRLYVGDCLCDWTEVIQWQLLHEYLRANNLNDDDEVLILSD